MGHPAATYENGHQMGTFLMAEAKKGKKNVPQNSKDEAKHVWDFGLWHFPIFMPVNAPLDETFPAGMAKLTEGYRFLPQIDGNIVGGNWLSQDMYDKRRGCQQAIPTLPLPSVSRKNFLKGLRVRCWVFTAPQIRKIR